MNSRTLFRVSGKTLALWSLGTVTAVLLAASIPAARLLRPERMVFIRTDFGSGAEKETVAQWENAAERLRDSAAIKLRSLAGQCGVDLAEGFAPDGGEKRIAFVPLRSGLAPGLRAWMGKTDDLILDIASGGADTTLVYTLRTPDGETIACDTASRSVSAAGNRSLLREICRPAYPTAVLMEDYRPDPHDPYMESVNRLRLYRSGGILLGDTTVFEQNEERAEARAATMGLLCEGFARVTGDTAALRRADEYFRRAAMPHPVRGDTTGAATSDALIGRFLDARTQLPSQCRQLILVYNDTAPRVSCIFRRYEKQGESWREVAPAIPANAGRNGIAPYGGKREGDGRSPSGVYPLGTAFGYRRDLDIAWPFLVVGKDHCWISDPQHPDYNRMTDRIPSTDDFEYLRREDDAYKYAVVVEYNTHPVEKYRGSAIFFHIEKGFDQGSAGCITVAEASIVEVLRWLDPERMPCMLIGTLPGRDAES